MSELTMDHYNRAIDEATLNGIEVHGIFPQPAIDVIKFLQKEIDGYRNKIKDLETYLETKKEPAPAATDTDSTSESINSLYPNDSIDLDVCQDALERAVRGYLGIYEQMTESEQRAWELGEAFAELARARGLFV